MFLKNLIVMVAAFFSSTVVFASDTQTIKVNNFALYTSQRVDAGIEYWANPRVWFTWKREACESINVGSVGSSDCERLGGHLASSPVRSVTPQEYGIVDYGHRMNTYIVACKITMSYTCWGVAKDLNEMDIEGRIGGRVRNASGIEIEKAAPDRNFSIQRHPE